MKTNLMHYLSSFYFVSQLLRVSGIFVAHYKEVYFIYTTTGTCCIYSIPPDDGLKKCPKRVEVDWRNKLRTNSASSWFSLHRCIEMHGQQNIKRRVYVKSQNWKCAQLLRAFLCIMFLSASIGSEYIDDQVNPYQFHSD